MSNTYSQTRFDQYDYQRFGLTERWKVDDIIALLISFNLETNGLHDSDDCTAITDKLYQSYFDMFRYMIYGNKPKYHNVYSDEDDLPTTPGTHWGTGITTYDKCELLDYLENNVRQIDVERLKRFISGEERPFTPLSAAMPISESEPDVATDAISPNENESVAIAIEEPTPEADITPSAADEDIKAEPAPTEHKYRFIKFGLGWNIQFGEMANDGVNHSVGMDYIKTLLQNPYIDIGVLDLQAMMNPDSIKSSREKILNEFKDNDSEDGLDGPDLTDSQVKVLVSLPDDKRAEIRIYSKQVIEYKSELKEARLNNDTANASRLSELINILEDQLKTILKSRTDDPVLKSNRKNVWKNIEDARKNIQTAEIANGYADTPIYNYLKKFIETGYTCKYNPLADDPIHWIF